MPRKDSAPKKTTVSKKKAGQVIPEQGQPASVVSNSEVENFISEQVQPMADGLSDEERYERISRRAYKLYEQRGWEHGKDLDDWLTAERLEAEERSAFPKLNSV